MKSSIRACHVLHLIEGVLYLEWPLMEILLYTATGNAAMCNTDQDKIYFKMYYKMSIHAYHEIYMYNKH